MTRLGRKRLRMRLPINHQDCDRRLARWSKSLTKNLHDRFGVDHIVSESKQRLAGVIWRPFGCFEPVFDAFNRRWAIAPRGAAPGASPTPEIAPCIACIACIPCGPVEIRRLRRGRRPTLHARAPDASLTLCLYSYIFELSSLITRLAMPPPEQTSLAPRGGARRPRRQSHPAAITQGSLTGPLLHFRSRP